MIWIWIPDPDLQGQDHGGEAKVESAHDKSWGSGEGIILPIIKKKKKIVMGEMS